MKFFIILMSLLLLFITFFSIHSICTSAIIIIILLLAPKIVVVGNIQKKLDLYIIFYMLAFLVACAPHENKNKWKKEEPSIKKNERFLCHYNLVLRWLLNEKVAILNVCYYCDVFYQKIIGNKKDIFIYRGKNK